jgi:hypothetical protein
MVLGWVLFDVDTTFNLRSTLRPSAGVLTTPPRLL